jgi:hypothetical protein
MKAVVLFSLLLMGALAPGLAVATGETSIMLPAVADNYVDSKYPKSAYGSTSFLFVGNKHDREQDVWGSERIYIRFDLSSLPKNRVILRATLWLWQYYAPSANQTYEAHRVLGDWNETTENWENQPAWASEKTSEAVVPTLTEAAVEWDITKDVAAWHSMKAPNHGTMIKVAKETRDPDASSGFWGRIYPVEKWQPRLIVVLGADPKYSYLVTFRAAGLPPGVVSPVTVDGKPDGSLSSDNRLELVFDRGTTHTIEVNDTVAVSPTTRYRCDVSQVHVSDTGSYAFAYRPEYFVTLSTRPESLFQTPPSAWYLVGSTLALNRTGADLISTAPGTRIIFDGWYVNGTRLTVEPRIIIVNGSLNVEGRYRVEYYVNVTSPVGEARGSGWYQEGSVASFSVDRTTVSAEGFLGTLGLRRSFRQWTGSNSFVGLPMEQQGRLLVREPSVIQAIWEDDWGSVIMNLVLAAALAVALVVVVAMTRMRHAHTRREPSERHRASHLPSLAAT